MSNPWSQPHYINCNKCSFWCMKIIQLFWSNYLQLPFQDLAFLPPLFIWLYFMCVSFLITFNCIFLVSVFVVWKKTKQYSTIPWLSADLLLHNISIYIHCVFRCQFYYIDGVFVNILLFKYLNCFHTMRVRCLKFTNLSSPDTCFHSPFHFSRPVLKLHFILSHSYIATFMLKSIFMSLILIYICSSDPSTGLQYHQRYHHNLLTFVTLVSSGYFYK